MEKYHIQRETVFAIIFFFVSVAYSVSFRKVGICYEVLCKFHWIKFDLFADYMHNIITSMRYVALNLLRKNVSLKKYKCECSEWGLAANIFFLLYKIVRCLSKKTKKKMEIGVMNSGI